jgi:hypothetical protein
MKEPPMKAPDILRAAHGQFAGAVVRAGDLSERLRSLSAVADDVASGVTPLEGIDPTSAAVLAMSLDSELGQVDALRQQMRHGLALLDLLTSRLPPN